MCSAPRKRRGNVVILSLFLMVIVFVCLAVAIDVGYINLLRTRLQVAADAGAMAGTDAMGDGAQAGIEAAERFAELNFDNVEKLDVVSSEDIELGTWDDETRQFQPLSGTDLRDAFAVRVTCRRTVSRASGVTLFFARLFGKPTADVSAVAVARARASTCGRIIGLERVTMSGSSYTDSYNSALGPYSAQTPRQRGHVCSNGSILTSGTTEINGNAHPGMGEALLGSATVSGTTASLTATLEFPPVQMGTVPTVNNNGQIPLTASGVAPTMGTQLVLTNADMLELPPGVYYFTRMVISNGASLRVSGPTYMFVDGDCLFSGGGIVNATLKPSYFQLYSTGENCAISGSTDFYGVIYAPNARIIRSGPSNIFGMLLGRELNLSGTGGIHADEALGHLKGMANRYTVLVD